MRRSPWISDLRWVRSARRPRSRRTLGSLLDVAEALISEKGIDDTAVGDVASTRCRRSLRPWCLRARARLGPEPAALRTLAASFEADLRACGEGPPGT